MRFERHDPAGPPAPGQHDGGPGPAVDADATHDWLEAIEAAATEVQATGGPREVDGPGNVVSVWGQIPVGTIFFNEVTPPGRREPPTWRHSCCQGTPIPRPGSGVAAHRCSGQTLRLDAVGMDARVRAGGDAGRGGAAMRGRVEAPARDHLFVGAADFLGSPGAPSLPGSIGRCRIIGRLLRTAIARSAPRPRRSSCPAPRGIGCSTRVGRRVRGRADRAGCGPRPGDRRRWRPSGRAAKDGEADYALDADGLLSLRASITTTFSLSVSPSSLSTAATRV
jgi:hypothetical protein